MNELKAIHDWNVVAGNEHKPDTALFILYLDLIEEELTELKGAKTQEEVMDSIGDLLVVVTGAAHAIGKDAEEILRRVNISNFSKFAKSEYEAKLSVEAYQSDSRYENVRYEKVGAWYVIRGDKVNGGKNKILKSINYKEPNWEGLV